VRVLKQVSKDRVVHRDLLQRHTVVGTYVNRALAAEGKRVHAETREIQKFRGRNTMCTVLARRMRDPERGSEGKSR
jgi:hypothetical protein